MKCDMKTFYYIITAIITNVFIFFILVAGIHLCSDQSSIYKVDITLMLIKDLVSADTILKANT